jgi:hypothetical protein
MMKRLLTLGAILISSYIFSQAKIEFNETYKDFGAVKEGEKPTFIFKFENTGTKPLVLSSVKPSCGCTSPFWSRDTVKPGDSGEIKVQYNSANRLGRFAKTVRVQSNAVNNLDAIKIYGLVYNPGVDTVDNNFGLAPKIELAKKSYSLGEIQTQADVSTEILIKNIGVKPLKIESVQAGCGCVREKEQLVINPGEQKMLTIFVRPREVGAFTVKALIASNDSSNQFQEVELSFVAKESLGQDNMMFSKPGTGF